MYRLQEDGGDIFNTDCHLQCACHLIQHWQLPASHLVSIQRTLTLKQSGSKRQQTETEHKYISHWTVQTYPHVARLSDCFSPNLSWGHVVSTPYIRPPPNRTMLYQTPPGLTYGATHTQYSTICKQNAHQCTSYTHIATTYTTPMWYPPTFQYGLLTHHHYPQLQTITPPPPPSPNVGSA